MAPDAWRRLYALAADVRALAPWQWMSENDVFAVRTRADAEPAFVSVMGEIGQHFAVGAYLGVAAFQTFVALQTATEEDEPERLLEIPQLQLSFADRRVLDARDLELIRSLSLKFRGRRAWPLFRSYRPGRVPWFLHPGEKTVLAAILEQLLEVAPRARADRSVLWPPGQGNVLVRVRRRDGPWEDRVEHVPPPSVPVFSVDSAVADHLRRLPPSTAVVEADLFVMPGTIADGKDAPSLIYSLMLVDAASGFILGAELLEPKPDVASMLARVPTALAAQLVSAGTRPAAIRGRTDRVLTLLQPLAVTGVALRRSPTLPALEAARRALVAHFAR